MAAGSFDNLEWDPLGLSLLETVIVQECTVVCRL
jgi:hypothetical protein